MINIEYSLMRLDLRTLYTEKRFWEELLPMAAGKEKPETVDMIRDRVAKYKKVIREKNRKGNGFGDRHIIHGDYDGYTVKIKCPDWIQSMEDAEEWFDEFERMEYKWSPYDCTGQWFTCWHRIFFVNGEWICYHCVAMDV